MPKKIKKVRVLKAKTAQVPGMVAYRFFDGKNEFGKQSHLHQVMRDAKVGWENLSGVSSITKVIAKPLTWWAAGETLKVLGWTNSKIRVDGRYQSVALESRLALLKPIWEGIRTMDDLAIIKLLDTAYKAHDTRLDESADKGIDLHAELEKYVKLCIEKYQGKPCLVSDDNGVFLEATFPKINRFAVWAVKNVKRFLWSEMYSYNLDLWIGGCCDAGAEMKDGKYAIIDFKSHEYPYFSDWVQIAGYDLLISKTGGFTKDGNKVFDLDKPISKYYLIPFKAENFVANIGVNSEVEALKRSFLAAATLNREKSKYEKY